SRCARSSTSASGMGTKSLVGSRGRGAGPVGTLDISPWAGSATAWLHQPVHAEALRLVRASHGENVIVSDVPRQEPLGEHGRAEQGARAVEHAPGGEPADVRRHHPYVAGGVSDGPHVG